MSSIREPYMIKINGHVYASYDYELNYHMSYICLLLSEEKRNKFLLDFFTSYTGLYWPIPVDYKLRLKKLPLTELIAEGVNKSVILSLLTCDEMKEPTLGEAMRVVGLTSSNCIASKTKIPDYSYLSIAEGIMNSKPSKEDTLLAKKLILKSFEEQLALQLFNVSLEGLEGEIRLTDYPDGNTESLEITCPPRKKCKVFLEKPSWCHITQQGVGKIKSLIEADMALSKILWKELGINYYPVGYNRVAECLSSMNIEQLGRLDHIIGVFLFPFPFTLKDYTTDLLISKYNGSTNDIIDFTCYDRHTLGCILAECCSSRGEINTAMVKERMGIYIKNKAH